MSQTIPDIPESRDIPDFDLHKAVDLAVVTEQNGQRFYEKLARRFEGDHELHRIFARLARDESDHEDQFRRLREQLPPEPPEKRSAAPYGASVLRAISLSKFFSNRFGERELSEPKDALVEALELEKSTRSYYLELAEHLGHPEVLDRLIAAETEHIETLMQVVLTDARFRGLADTWPA